MSIEYIAKILDMHSVPHYVSGGRIFADSMIAGTDLFQEVEDLTGCTKKELFVWLGY